MSGVTPVRSNRQSLGNSMITPKARGPRASMASEMMPPPPSPGNIGRVVQAHQTQLDEEINELRKKNAQLEAELHSLGSEDERIRLEALRNEVDRVKEEADSLRQQLSASQADAADASRLAEELQATSGGSSDALTAKEQELKNLQEEMVLAGERAAGELAAAMESKAREILRLEERAGKAEGDAAEFQLLADQLTEAGQVGSSFVLYFVEISAKKG